MKGVVPAPAQDLAGCPIHDHSKVKKSMSDRDIGDITGPDLIGVKLVFGCYLLDRLVTAKRFKRYLRLVLIGKTPSRRTHVHKSSCSKQYTLTHCPLFRNQFKDNSKNENRSYLLSNPIFSIIFQRRTASPLRKGGQ